ncbi:MAG: hypothetical protein IJ243_04020 [Prevotella sp.]|nr:hypothetical protein [Prevotella sp.]
MKNGRFEPFWTVFTRRQNRKKGLEGSKIAQTKRFAQLFPRFFASFHSFLSTPNFQKSTPFEKLALTFESEKAPIFVKFSVRCYLSSI